MVKKYIKLAAVVLTVMASSAMKAQDYTAKFKKIKTLGGVEEFMYEPSGMNVLLVQDNSAPVVTVQVVYRVGSKHEVPGNTGSTHLLEHLNFKGTPTFNKKNGNSIFAVLQGIGAQMNATTWNDRTNYYETIPSDKIELALHIEADRMRNSLLLKEDKDSEMTVVRNEFERGENSPGSLLNKEIWATAYMAHPYHHSTIGWRSDIENMPIEVLRDFYNTYYWPDNATLTIIGDFKKDEVFNLVDKYFGPITKAPHSMPQPYTTEPEQFGPRRLIIKKTGQQALVNIAYKIPGRMHDDLPALQVLGQILGSGTSSVINKTFVDTGIANNGYANASNFQEVGLFTIALGLTPDKDIEAISTQMLAMVETIKSEGVAQEDVDRIVSKLNANTILSRDGSGSIAGDLTEAIAGGDWTDYVTASERLSKVTAADVKRVANTYLEENQSTTGYFIPANEDGGSSETKDEVSKFTADYDSKYYYRHPENTGSHSNQTVSGRENFTSGYETIQSSASGEKFTRKDVVGIDVVTAKTGAKGFVNVAASFSIEAFRNTHKNELIPDFTVGMLSKGTTKHNKFQFSEKLEKLGTNISLSSNANTVTIRFKCLTEDLDTVVALLAEELRLPLFDEKEFDLLKQQSINGLKRGLTDPGTQGTIALLEAIYPKDHPNYRTDIETSIKNIEALTLEDLKAFHKTYFGLADMHLVAVGDVNTKELYNALKQNFKGWNKGVVEKADFKAPVKGEGKTKVITIPKKPSAQMYIGQYTGIERNDAEYLPFYLGTSILGGGFSGRLMQTVRDNDGLTYGISASHAGDNKRGGYWLVDATFNPSLFEKGLDATMVQLKKWVNEGVTADELQARKNNITGSYKVGMATTSGMARALLSVLERGLSPDYLEQFPKDVEAVTLEEVNQAIKKHIDLNNLIIIKSGSLKEDGTPLE
ncbi:M16 family metallopeptidase [Formosa sp. S-31]|uniref:M16 family metallopeptidase n=1 Tax=Formosa sp. S-31 TaxID=2790949 RepID=UPI003EC053EA